MLGSSAVEEHGVCSGAGDFPEPPWDGQAPIQQQLRSETSSSLFATRLFSSLKNVMIRD